jgi:hypothetical protein
LDINFHTIRPFSNSKNLGFEELCCQLAHCESYPDDAIFTRRGTPDQGIECLWTLSDGTLQVWQAKYFFELGDSQWANIDESVKTAIAEHPKLKKYTLCLPKDRSTSGEGKKWSQMQRWNARVTKWNKWAAEVSLEIDFCYWGSHELTLRLTKDEQAGRRYYWFSQQVFSAQWIKEHVQETEKRAGPRFSTELNVGTNAGQIFDALARTPDFLDRLRSSFHDVRASWRRGLWDRMSSEFKASYGGRLETLEAGLDQIAFELENIEVSCLKPLPFDELRDRSRSTAEEALGAARYRAHGSREDRPERLADTADRHERSLHELAYSLQQFAEEISSKYYQIANNPFLLLSGDAGEGKTHSLVDFAQRLSASGAPVVFVFGHALSTGNLWRQIIDQLHLQCSRDEFLGALDAAAEAIGRRGIIIIDAVNEGSARDLWRDELPAMVEIVRRYPNLGLVVSCRSSYRRLIERDDLVPTFMTHMRHPGLEGIEFEATKAFFAHYGCEQPTTPMLFPEFRNALFLKVFCVALADKRIKIGKAPAITSVFEAFLTAVDDVLSEPKRMDYRRGSRLVHAAAEELARQLDIDSKMIPVEVAEKICNQLLASPGYSNSLLANLISEGVLWKDVAFSANDDLHEVVMFSYDRFADYMIGKRLLAGVTVENSRLQLEQSSELRRVLDTPQQARRYAGVVDALAVLLPERLGLEICDVTVDSEIAKLAFLKGLSWRAADTYSERTLQLYDSILNADGWDGDALSAMLSSATIADHPLNADTLDGRLRQLQLADRDAVWSTYLSRYSEKGSPVQRLLDWAWPPDERVYADELNTALDSDSWRLAVKVLMWFHTTSDRFVRDRATKAVVNLLRRRPDLAIPCHDLFCDVDDPYVVERLYAVLYGAVLHLDDSQAIDRIARRVFEQQFANGSPAPNMMLRDYARGIIEYARINGLATDLPIEVCRPPYQSNWPADHPRFDDVKAALEDSAYWELTSSLGDMGDFYCYSMNSIGYWSTHPIGKRPLEERRQENYVSKDTVRGWILQRVLDLGWTPERFVDFDSHVPRPSALRTDHKAERIGKKYQWIALQEYLAYLTDNREFGGLYGEDDSAYAGPWQTGDRDIDPSLLLRETYDRPWRSDDACWWSPDRYDFFRTAGMSHQQWLRDHSDHLNPDTFIEPTDPNGTSSWLNLCSYACWYEPVPKHLHRDDVDKRQYSFHVCGFVIQESHWPEMLAWLASDQQHEWDVPEAVGTLHVFLGEYAWAPIMDDWYFDYPWNTDEQAWHSCRAVSSPRPVAIPDARFNWERGYDCSSEEPFHGQMPAPWLMKKMSLRWGKRRLDFEDDHGRLIACDPSVNIAGPTALLVERQAIQEFLRSEKLKLFWRVSSEKLIIEKESNSDIWPGRVMNYWIYCLDKSEVRLKCRQSVHTTVGPTHEVFLNESFD